MRYDRRERKQFPIPSCECVWRPASAICTKEDPAYQLLSGPVSHFQSGSGLVLVNFTQIESSPLRDMLTYRFTSSHAGYGNRSGAMTAQVITEHTIRVTTADRNVESAVIDDRWDEMGKFLTVSTVSLTYQPMQCDKTVWDTWEANSGRVYIRAPTDAEIITHYYSSVHGIDVMNVTRVDSGMMSCEACGVCPVTYHFGLTVNASVMQALVDEGWVRSG